MIGSTDRSPGESIVWTKPTLEHSFPVRFAPVPLPQVVQHLFRRFIGSRHDVLTLVLASVQRGQLVVLKILDAGHLSGQTLFPGPSTAPVGVPAPGALGRLPG